MNDALGDDELWSGFDSAQLPKERFHHREHVRVAFLYLVRHGDLAEAALHFRRALRRFAARHGAEHIYHETLTWAYLVLVNERMQEGSFASSLEFLRRHPDLLDHPQGPITRYYHLGELMSSPRARRVFVLPEAGQRDHAEPA